MIENQLFPYQKTGIKWLKENRFGLLADEMGLGKSVQAIRAADELGLTNILIICMAVGRENWLREFAKWSKTSRKFSVLRKGSDSPTPDSVVITSYDYLANNTEKLRRPWDQVIFDEGHMLKSPTAKRTKAAVGKLGVIRQAKGFWMLSGTPAPNNFAEMWVLLFTLGKTKLNYDDFVKYFCVCKDSNYGPMIFGNKLNKVSEMKALLTGSMLRRKKEKGMLPDIFFQKFSVEPGEVVLEDCKGFADYFVPDNRKDELMARIERERTAVSNVIEAVKLNTRGEVKSPHMALEGLASSVSTLRRYLGLQKVKSVAEAINWELENKAYEKIVVFAIHRDPIYHLRELLKKWNPVCLMGGMDDDKKQKSIDKFKNHKTCRVFIGNIQAAGTTINLTVAHNIIFLEQDWVPGNNAQAIMRVHRIGQTKPVTIRFACVDNSIDEKVNRSLRRKAAELCTIFDEKPYEEFDDAKNINDLESIILPDFKRHEENSLSLEKKQDISGNKTKLETPDIDIFS